MKKVQYYAKTLGLIFSYLLMGFGLASWLFHGVIFSGKDEIPLGDITGFVVDSQGNIYFGSGFYQRIQVYNKKGQFIRNWNVEAFGGTYSINITEKDNILINLARSDEQIIYDKNGNILLRKKQKRDEPQNKSRDKYSFVTENRINYKFQGSLIQELVKTNPEITIIRQSLFLQLMRGPLNPIILMVIGMLLVGLFRREKYTPIYKIPT
jgi:hypothetical protein